MNEYHPVSAGDTLLYECVFVGPFGTELQTLTLNP